MADQIITSFGVLNYSGLLFNRGNTSTPLSSSLNGKTAYTNHVEFVTGQEYTVGGGSQPEISETASLTAPDSTFVTRSQNTNVTQIFQETVYISYAKQSNMGTLSGINIANQQANPEDELDFQVKAKMQKIANDIEYTFINGVYNKATKDNEANKTRGLVSAITTNVKAMSSKALGYWDIVDMMKKISESNGDVSNLELLVDGVTLLQVNADCHEKGITVVEGNRNEAGINVVKIVTPYGELGMRLQPFLPAGTALMVNNGVIRPVEQPVPNKGNFFLEELAKTGAGTKYQIFGQLGLDHGPEWCHGKFTGIKQSFTAPTGVTKVEVTNTTDSPVNTKEVA